MGSIFKDGRRILVRPKSLIICLCLISIIFTQLIRYQYQLIADEVQPTINEDHSSSQSLKNTKLNSTRSSSPISPPKSLNKLTSQEFWEHIFNIFEINKFDDGLKPLIKYTPKEQQLTTKIKTRDWLLSKANIFHKDIIRQYHESVLRNLPSKLPKSVYTPNTYGIVTIGGNFYSWMAYIQLLQLRKLGSNLPVEILIPSIEDYYKEAHFCDHVLPQYNAKCILVPEKLGFNVAKHWKFSSYQFKALALCLSSFQHVLILDSDNVVLLKPEKVFDSPVYRDNGMVLWPDYWERTISPEWYDIIGKPIVGNKQVRTGRFPVNIHNMLTSELEINETRFHDLEGALPDLSTESGQVMFNKKTHGKVMLMTLYYNIFGPEIYYKLFSLGALGEGDKDTFAAAALACGEKYYQVASSIRTLGYFDTTPGGGFHGMAMAQKNPQLDYQLFQKTNQNFKDLHLDWDNEAKDQFSANNKIPIFTMHCNIKKINPAAYMKDEKIANMDEKRMNVRFYSNLKFKLNDDDIYSPDNEKEKNKSEKTDNDPNEIDFELSRWQIVSEILCDQKITFQFLKDENMDEVCQFVKNTIAWLGKKT